MASLLKNRMKSVRGQEIINQIEHVDQAGARLVMGGVLVPGDVITADVSVASVLVGVGSILRIQVGADTYVAFGDDTLGAVSITTTPAIKLPAGYHLVVATDDFIRASASFTRLEVIS